MANKKDFTIEELKKMYEDATKECETIGEMLKQKEKDEEDKKKAQLTLEKENRKKELNEAREHYNTLLEAYIKDYGTCAYGDDGFFINSFWGPSFF